MIDFEEYIELCSAYLTQEPHDKEGRFYKDHIFICSFTDYDTVVAWLDVYINKNGNTITTGIDGKEYVNLKDFEKDLNIFLEKYRNLKKELRKQMITKL